MLPAFQKRCKILELMAEFNFGTFMLNLGCEDLIFEEFQNFYTSITSAHPDRVKTSMQNIMSLFLEGDVDICKIPRSKLLIIWRKEPIASSVAYDLVEKLVMQNIKLLRRVLTRKELKRINGGSKNKENKTCSKNELRRRGLCFVCKGPWALNHSCLGDRKESKRTKKEEIPSNHGNSSVVGFSSFQKSTNKGSEQSSTYGVQQHNVFQRDLRDKPMITSQLDKVHGERKEVILPNDVVDSCKTKSIDGHS